MKIVLSLFSRKLRNGNRNPKDYHWANELTELLNKNYHTIQIGITGEPSIGAKEVVLDKTMQDLTNIILDCDVWISVDNFLPHMMNCVGKPGVVIWGKSDPKIFGYKQNMNILKSDEFLRKNQFDIWENESYDEKVFVIPAISIGKNEMSI